MSKSLNIFLKKDTNVNLLKKEYTQSKKNIISALLILLGIQFS